MFVSREQFNEIFEKESDYYSGYLSNEVIEDIDENLIAAEITEDDYTKSSRQLKQSMRYSDDAFYYKSEEIRYGYDYGNHYRSISLDYWYGLLAGNFRSYLWLDY